VTFKYKWRSMRIARGCFERLPAYEVHFTWFMRQGWINAKDLDRFIYDIVGFDGSDTLKHIAEDCQVSLILHGHQHEREQSVWEWKHGKGMCRILSAGSWGLSPQKMPQDEPNSAQLVLLDPGSREISVCTLKYEPKPALKAMCPKVILYHQTQSNVTNVRFLCLMNFSQFHRTSPHATMPGFCTNTENGWLTFATTGI